MTSKTAKKCIIPTQYTNECVYEYNSETTQIYHDFFVRFSTNIFKKYPFESKKENVFYIPLFLKLS